MLLKKKIINYSFAENIKNPEAYELRGNNFILKKYGCMTSCYSAASFLALASAITVSAIFPEIGL